MKVLARPLPFATICLLFSQAAFAQDEPTITGIPNPMAIHTWFIIIAAGAFLAWSISYSLQLQKEALAKKKGREDARQMKEDLLDKIAALEDRKEAGEVSERQYKQEMKELKFRLSKALEKTPKANEASGKT